MSTAPQIPGLVYVQPLGQGGYADVYLYEQQSPRMPVAVKVLKGTGLTDEVVGEFLTEADTMAALGDHPYIVQVFRAGTAQDGRPYLVMKYYPPPNLAQRSRAERFAVPDVLRMGIQLASAIQTAHNASIIHRDIKPANVLMSAYGAPGLTDFGIAGRGGLAEAAQREDLGVSVPWSAPEVVFGESDGDARSDIYALAATLWQLLTGRSPFELPGQDNSAFALMQRIRSMAVPATGRSDVPPSLERLLSQAMSKDPSHRPQSAMDLARGLQAVETDLRLPRTQILVLDDVARPVSRTPLTTQPAPAEDRTHVKGPQRVTAQPALPPATPTSPSSPPSQPTPEPTSQRPRPTIPPAPVPGQTAYRTTSPQPVAEVSHETPLRAAYPPEETTLVTRTPSSRTPWVAAVAVLALLLGAALTWILLRPKETDLSGPTRTPIATVIPSSDSSAIGDGVFVAPFVTAEGRGGAVRFTWTYESPSVRDTYRVLVGPTHQEALQATPVTVTIRSHEVAVAAGKQACAVVSVVRSGQISPASVVKCATAQ